ncbi:MAG: cadherin-like domain-containing protein [Verrucomicrobiaceae bacterium]|nr:cadherin-like domain-containing protein [Verrucomicrobiaceae bacterium]
MATQLHAQLPYIAKFDQSPMRPTSGLLAGPNLDNSNERLYGLSEFGGSGGSGVMFSWEPATDSFVTQVDFGKDFYVSGVISNISGKVGRGQQRIARPSAGNVLFGVAREGGNAGYGLVWRWDPAQATAKLTKVADFDMTSTGGYPEFGVITDGTNLYGTCSEGGGTGVSVGTIWKLPVAGGALSIIYTFNETNTIGKPLGGVTLASGELFGLSEKSDGTRVLWKVNPNTVTLPVTPTIVYTFSATTDGKPTGTLATGTGNNVFGALLDVDGGTGDGVFMYNLISAPTEIIVPAGGFFQAVGDVFLSTAGAEVFASARTSTSRGSVFTWDRQNTSSMVSVGTFGGTATDPLLPTGTMVKGSGGIIYGTSQLGGDNEQGCIWKLSGSTSTTAGTMSKEHSFTGPPVGANPQGIAAEANGNIYGTESFGSSIWRWNPITGASTIIKLASASYVGDGFPPVGQLAIDSSGAVYGVTEDGGSLGNGSLWKWTQHGGLTRIDIKVGTTPIPGKPSGGLVIDALNNLYGISNQISGPSNDPPVTTLWRRSSNGVFSILKTFSAATNGAFCIGTLAVGPSMNQLERQMTVRGAGLAIYGICVMGGALNGGSLWAYELDGEGFEVRSWFRDSVGNSGQIGRARGGLVALPDGTVFGTSGGFNAEAGKLWKWIPAQLPEDDEDPPPPMPPYDAIVHANFNATNFGRWFEFPTGRTNPNGAVVLGQCAIAHYGGSIYGLTDFGTSLGCGALWTASPTSPANLAVSKQLRRSDSYDGGRGLANMVVGADGRLFGATPNALWAAGTASPTVPPTVVTDAATGVFATRVTFAGRVNPNGLNTTVTIEWGLSESALTNVITVPGTLSGTAVQNVSGEATFLSPNTDYFYRVVAVNSAGTSRGSIAKQKTNVAGQVPVVTTLAASSISHDSAVLNGTVTPNHPTTNVFDWGIATVPPGTRTAATPGTATGSSPVNVSATLTGLAPHTTYHYRTVAASDQGITIGSKLVKFTTANRPPTSNPDMVKALPSAPLTINVVGNDTDPDGDALSVSTFTQPLAALGKVTKVGNDLVFTPTKTFNSTATFTYIAKDAFGGVSTPATVTVELDTIGISPTALTIPAAAQTYTINVDTGNAGTPWTVVETSPFITVNPSKGMGDGSFQVSVIHNTSKTARIAKVIVCGVEHTLTQDGVVAPAFPMSIAVPPAIVSGAFVLPITTTTPALPVPTFSTTKLPKGLSLKVNATTGAVTIEGTPELPGSFPVTVKASNAALPAASAASLSFTIEIQPLPSHFIGRFVGLFDSYAEVNNGHGAYVEMTTTATGSCTGKLTLGTATSTPETLSFAGRIAALPAPPPALITDPPNPVPPATLQVEVKRPGKGVAPLVLMFTLNTAATAGDNILTGSLDVKVPETPSDTPAAALLAGWRNKWNALSDPASTKEDLNNVPLDDYFTASLDLPPGSVSANPPVPLGNSFSTVTIKPDGSVISQVYLGDNERSAATQTVVSRMLKRTSIVSPVIGNFQKVIVFHPLYKKTTGFYYGVVTGVINIDRSVPVNTPEPLSGVLDWVKLNEPANATPKAQPGFTYTAGYTTTLTVAGARYEPPTNGVALGLPGGTTNNTRITFANGGLAGSAQGSTLTQNFILGTTNTSTFADPNATGLKLVFDNKLGLFSGEFKLTDNVGGKVIVRPVFFQGVLLPDPAAPANGRGKGCFVLRALPPTATGTTATTDRFSGSIEIQSL